VADGGRHTARCALLPGAAPVVPPTALRGWTGPAGPVRAPPWRTGCPAGRNSFSP